MRDKLQQLYVQEMSRYDFLKFMGVVTLSVLGVTSLLKLISHADFSSMGKAEHGYGSSAYGGGAELGAMKH